MKLLLTAFDPFGGDKVNPALEAVKLVSSHVNNVEVVKAEVPTVFRKSIATVAAAIAKEKPDAVLCIGQAGGRYDITPERVAINLDDARIKDNEGNQPIDLPIYEDGAPAYFSDLPIKAMVQNIREAGLPASVSNTAGTFVCNHLMYGVLYTLAKEYPGVRGGFMQTESLSFTKKELDDAEWLHVRPSCKKIDPYDDVTSSRNCPGVGRWTCYATRRTYPLYCKKHATVLTSL